MTESKKDVVKKDEYPLRTSGEGQSVQGFDDVEKEDLKMPRLAVLQQMSELVAEGKGKMGDLANSITKEVYGDSIEFIALFLFKSRVQFEVGRGLVMMSLDNQTVSFGVDEFEKYAGLPVSQVPGIEWQGKEPPTFNLVYNFPCLLAGERVKEFPMGLSLMRTATKAAKDFISMARFANEDIFARVYTLKTEIIKGEKGTYATPKIEFSRRCTDEEYAVARGHFASLFKKKANIEVDLGEEPLASTNLNEEEKEPDNFEE